MEMMKIMREEFLWVEKYRPKTVSECVLPDGLKSVFQTFVDEGEIPNLMLTGRAGIGKTTIARALCEELDCDYIIVNGSEESGIDVLRNKIKNFASTVSLTGGSKVVILDESDYLNPQSTQPALRGFIEEFSTNCRFIFTANFANRIIPPLHSRCTVIEFKIQKGDLPKVASQFAERIHHILEKENVTLTDDKVLLELIKKFLPDWRRILNELQGYSVGGTVDIGILSSFDDSHISELASFLKSKNFMEMRKWVVRNLDNDQDLIYRKLYDNMHDHLTPAGLPPIILLLADYQYKSAFAADQDINLTACLIEIMIEGQWQ